MQTPMHRRHILRLSAAASLSLGLWPGCARFGDAGHGEAFRFAVLNDCHFHTPKCGPWFERVRDSLAALNPWPEFCLVVGDLAENGTAAELGQMRDALRSFDCPSFTVPGNHDLREDAAHAYDRLFPKSRNYFFSHRGWQFVGLDSTEGTKWQNTSISGDTLEFAAHVRRRLSPAVPTVLFTHFPLGDTVSMRPSNADPLLEEFRNVNLVAVFNGHFHGFTQRRFHNADVTTNCCCSISRENHDGTTSKGFFVCDAVAGSIHRQSVIVSV